MFGGRKEELLTAVREASARFDILDKHFLTTEEGTDSKDRDFMYRLLRAYIADGQNRESQMALFAEGAQLHFSYIKSILDYLGLPLTKQK